MNLAPWQLQVLARYGEGPHIAALAFIPIAALLFLRLLRSPSLSRYIWAAVVIAVVALFNWIGFFSLVVILLIVLISEMLTSKPWDKLKRGLWCALISYGLIAFWFNLSFIKASFAFGGVGGQPPSSILLGIFIALVVLGVLFATLSKKPKVQPYFILGAWFFVFLIIAVLWYQFDITLASQPNRYMPELNMAACALLAVGITLAYDKLKSISLTRSRLVGWGFLGCVAVVILVTSLPFMKTSHEMTAPQEDIAYTSEYQVSHWLSSHVSGDERVYATGNHAFWLDAFSSVPQVRGGTDQGATNKWWEHMSYQVNKGSDGEIAVLWCRAFNIKYIVVNYGDSDVPYHDYTHPDKFEGLLTPAYQYNPHQRKGDIVYEVPLQNNSLAKIVDGNKLRALEPPESGSDKPRLQAYVNLVDGSSTAGDVTWLGSDALDIDCITTDDEVIVLQVTNDPGWHATVDGKPCPIGEDPLGFIVLDPGGAGEHHIELRHHPTADVWFGRVASIATVGGLVIVGVRRRKKLAMMG
jgi:hypothetical protein